MEAGMYQGLGLSLMRGLVAGMLVLLAGLATVSAQTLEREIVLNGEFLSPQDVYVLDQLAGGYVPDGEYWLDAETGIWGYAGDPTPQGRIDGSGTDYGYVAPDYAGELYRGYFGDYMSDGNCSFVNSVRAGTC